MRHSVVRLPPRSVRTRAVDTFLTPPASSLPGFKVRIEDRSKRPLCPSTSSFRESNRIVAAEAISSHGYDQHGYVRFHRRILYHRTIEIGVLAGAAAPAA